MPTSNTPINELELKYFLNKIQSGQKIKLPKDQNDFVRLMYQIMDRHNEVSLQKILSSGFKENYHLPYHNFNIVEYALTETDTWALNYMITHNFLELSKPVLGSDQSTALLIALTSSNIPALKILLEKGADPFVRIPQKPLLLTYTLNDPNREELLDIFLTSKQFQTSQGQKEINYRQIREVANSLETKNNTHEIEHSLFTICMKRHFFDVAHKLVDFVSSVEELQKMYDSENSKSSNAWPPPSHQSKALMEKIKEKIKIVKEANYLNATISTVATNSTENKSKTLWKI